MIKYISLLFVIGYFFIIYFFLLACNRKDEGFINLKTEINRYKVEAEHLKSTISVKLNTEGQKIENCNIISISGDSLKLKTLFEKGNRVILSYSELHCNICFDTLVKKISIMSSTLGHEKFAILANYQNPRDLFIFKRINNLNNDVYNFREGDLNLPMEILNAPFLFISDSNLIAENVFIPNKLYPELTDAYFEFIARKFMVTNQ